MSNIYIDFKVDVNQKFINNMILLNKEETIKFIDKITLSFFAWVSNCSPFYTHCKMKEKEM